jgi:hypothetical protein
VVDGVDDVLGRRPGLDGALKGKVGGHDLVAVLAVVGVVSVDLHLGVHQLQGAVVVGLDGEGGLGGEGGEDGADLDLVGREDALDDVAGQDLGAGGWGGVGCWAGIELDVSRLIRGTAASLCSFRARHPPS